MANKTIPQLNQVSAATDLDFLVITNSGETTTSKITKADFIAGVDTAGLINGTGVDSLKSADNLTPTYGGTISSGIGSIALGTQAEATDFAANAIGWNTEAAGSTAVAIGASARALADAAISIGNTSRSNNQGGISIGGQAQSRANNAVVIGQLRDSTGANSVNIGGGSTTINGDYSVLLGGQVGNINTTGDHNMILGGYNVKLTGATNHTTLINLTGFSSPVQSNTTYVDKLYSVGGQIDSTDYQLLVNSEGSTITSTSTKQTIIGGDNNTIPATNQYNAVINGRNTDISGNCVQSTSIGGYNNDINGVWWGLTIGGDGNKLNGTANTYGASYSTILGGASNTITNDAYNNGNGIISSSSSDILGASTQTTIMGGQDNLIEDAERASIIGGQNHQVKGTDASNKTTYSGIFVGFDNDVLGTSANSAIVGGTSNTLSSKNNSVMAATSGRTALYDGTLHTDNTHIYGTESKSTITGLTATGSVSVDLSTGSVFEFDITGNITDITFTNWREGGIYEFVVHNTGSYTITSSGVRLDGVANTIYAKGGSINPTNNGYTFYRMMIIDGKGWLNEHLNFVAM